MANTHKRARVSRRRNALGQRLIKSSNGRATCPIEAKPSFNARSPQLTKFTSSEQTQCPYTTARHPLHFMISIPESSRSRVHFWKRGKLAFLSWKTSKELFAEVARCIEVRRPIKSLRLSLTAPWTDDRRVYSEFIFHPGNDVTVGHMHDDFAKEINRATNDREFRITAHPTLQYTLTDVQVPDAQSEEDEILL